MTGAEGGSGFLIWLLMFGLIFYIANRAARAARETKIRELYAIGKMCDKTDRDIENILKESGFIPKPNPQQ